MSKFRSGKEAAAEGVSSAPFNKVGFFKLEEDEEGYYRFLMDYDEWQTVEVHSFVPVQKKAPEGYKSKWPAQIGVTCRKTKLQDGNTLYPDCYVCDHMQDILVKGKPIGRSSRSYTLGVRRDPVLGDGSEKLGGPEMAGQIVTFKDRTKQVAVVGDDGKPTGATQEVPEILIFSQGYKNFFSHLEGQASVHKTLLDRDYFIKRKGTSTETEYSVVHMDKVKTKVGDKVVTFDIRNPEIAARYGIKTNPDGSREYPKELDIEALIERQASDDYFGLYLDPAIEQPEARQNSNTNVTVSKPSNDKDQASMQALRDRVTKYSPPTVVTDEDGVVF